ncbi:HTH-type transcriptional regulator pecS [Vibrio nigripulchritudo ATCC 27043]|uniref:MarR family winged helix-turn-helix transcriptional regulator n=1 Tax=Vibrio nigripulchritudo TaxID=28173 RepID=UPI00021C224B|nr:MarR family transcriptional regulator [Vibrio nigripulchritudo]EGU61627.1 HTH-type transcriptional regulator pecS [Vibrio nigripulchritudo ATCC 27043]
MEYDHVDKLLLQWQKQRPELDCSLMGVVGRLRRMSQIIEKKQNKVFKDHNLTSVEFDILATLRRNNEPLTPTELYQTLMLSSGAMSTRIEHLVQRDLIVRVASNEDRRSCKVTLSEEGKALIDKAVEAHLANAEKTLSPLTLEEQNQLASIMRSWLVVSEK